MNELTLDGEKGREDVVAGLEGGEFVFDAEQFADEILNVGSGFNDEFGAGLGSEGFGEFTRIEEFGAEVRIELGEEGGIEFGEA